LLNIWSCCNVEMLSNNVLYSRGFDRFIGNFVRSRFIITIYGHEATFTWWADWTRVERFELELSSTRWRYASVDRVFAMSFFWNFDSATYPANAVPTEGLSEWRSDSSRGCNQVELYYDLKCLQKLQTSQPEINWQGSYKSHCEQHFAHRGNDFNAPEIEVSIDTSDQIGKISKEFLLQR
jgi:hypothetical protein